VGTTPTPVLPVGGAARRATLWRRRRAAAVRLTVVAALCAGLAWYATKPAPVQVELGQHLSAKYGTWLRTHDITAIHYAEEASSGDETVTASGQTADLSYPCHSGMSMVCSLDFTLFLGGTDRFDLVKAGNDYQLIAAIDRRKTPYADSERQVDRAMDRIVKDYEASRKNLTSWHGDTQ
jgi:hypothetical protein